MIELCLKDIKKIQIEILKEFVYYCEENNLVYYLGYGTLLGAVRHKGYIPWDDDIDIIMPRNDYDKFISNFNKENKNLEVLDISIESDYTFPFAKLSNSSTVFQEDYSINCKKLGVHIDIFPLDGIPNNVQEKTLNKIKFYRNILRVKYANISYEKKIVTNLIAFFGKVLFYFTNYREILKKIDKISREYLFETNNNVGCLVWNYGSKEIMNKNIFTKTIKIKFEDGIYNVPEKYDEYLKNLYGDYMTLPPEDKRVTHHKFKAYRK